MVGNGIKDGLIRISRCQFARPTAVFGRYLIVIFGGGIPWLAELLKSQL